MYFRNRMLCKYCADRQQRIARGNYYIGCPCVTIRENTERPITIKMGTNILAGTKKESIFKAFEEAVAVIHTAGHCDQ